MALDEARFALSFRTLAVWVLLLSSAVGAALALLGAPLLAFYLTPLLGAPLFIAHLRRLSPAIVHQSAWLRFAAPFWRGAYYLRRGLASSAVGSELTILLATVTLTVPAVILWQTLLPLGVVLASGVPLLVAFLLRRFGEVRRSPPSFWSASSEAVMAGSTLGRDLGADTRVVVEDSHGWAVREPAAARVSSRHQTEKEAEQAARAYLREHGGGEIVIKGRDGEIVIKDIVRPDPDAPASPPPPPGA